MNKQINNFKKKHCKIKTPFLVICAFFCMEEYYNLSVSHQSGDQSQPSILGEAAENSLCLRNMSVYASSRSVALRAGSASPKQSTQTLFCTQCNFRMQKQNLFALHNKPVVAVPRNDSLHQVHTHAHRDNTNL